MSRLNIIIAIILTSFVSCDKDKITISNNVSETFFVDNKNASMRVLVEGNTSSKTIILTIHGGPGAFSAAFNTDYISHILEPKYAMAYWDQRNAGASQGGNNISELKFENVVEDLKKVIQVLHYRYGTNTKIFIMSHSYGASIASSFLTKLDNQEMIDGWINIGGCNDNKKLPQFILEHLSKTSKEQIAIGNKVPEWEDIQKFCSNCDVSDPNQKDLLNDQAKKAEKLMGVESDLVKLFMKYAIKDEWPIMGIMANVQSNGNYSPSVSFTDEELARIKTPALFMYGDYDFTCPYLLGEYTISRLSTPETEKEMCIVKNAGHALWEHREVLFCDKVIDFVDKYKSK
ncbi:alpha/beta hydrolase [Halosquirtibacter laminarini]|uniref:Alpha/beta hydrolase n=1 Tax=Halosquirtibacter laminarini TaxID=3374600 RepID=A0AC61NHF3_9BACT|nr:alpha/beta hydrolase [Prolixibacteraceae bacterium]